MLCSGSSACPAVLVMEVSLHTVVLFLVPCLCSASPLEFKMESWRLREILPSGSQKFENEKNESREWGDDYLDFDLDNVENAILQVDAIC